MSQCTLVYHLLHYIPNNLCRPCERIEEVAAVLPAGVLDQDGPKWFRRLCWSKWIRFCTYNWKLLAYSSASLLTVVFGSFLLTMGAFLLTIGASYLLLSFLLTMGKFD